MTEGMGPREKAKGDRGWGRAQGEWCRGQRPEGGWRMTEGMGPREKAKGDRGCGI